VVLRALHLCSGYGGFELGLRLAGIPARTVAHVERDAYAAATLVARMGDQALDQAPIWSDLTTFDGSAWRGRVDLITAGFPCQPFSQAGQRRGVDDERWLWADIAGIVADVGPRFVLLENVPGLVRLGLPHVLADLADLGFDAEWGLLSAAAVGAPHRRERIWILAYAESERLEGGWPDGTRAGGTEPCGDGDADVGHASGAGRRQVARSTHGDEARDGAQHGDLADGASEDVADAESARRGERWRQTVEPPAVRRRGTYQRSEGVEQCSDGSGGVGVGVITPGRVDTSTTALGPFPPPPDDTDGWQRWTAQGGPQPSVRRSVDGRPVGLADALHLGGNGLVPRVAASALRQLAERAGVTL
jgi:DNA (cytosine-5)-methyltransferase 1